MLLGLEAERVHVDTLAGDVLVMLVRLDKVEVASITLGEPVMTVELELSSNDGVAAVLEGDGDEDVVGTTSGDTGHGTSVTISGGGGGVDEVGVGSREGTGVGLSTTGNICGVKGIGVVEPLLTNWGWVGAAVGNVVITLHNPHELFAGMIKVELDFVGSGAGRLVTGELELLDQVLVRDLGEPAAFISVEVDVVDE